MPTAMDKITSGMVDSRFPKAWLYWFQSLVKLVGNKLDTILSADGKIPVINADGELEASTLEADLVVQGPGSATVGNVAKFNNTTGTLLADAGAPLPDPSDTVTAETSFGQSSSAGSSTDYSRADHTHGTPAAQTIPSGASTVTAETAYGQSSNAGSAATFSKGDHTHGTPALPAIDDISDVTITSAEQGDVLYRNATAWVNLHHGLSGQVLTSGGHGADPSFANSDGWLPDSDTWVYVSAASFKISGKDVTTRFPVGCKLKLTQTTAKYFYVVSAAFSTDTTVTITGGSDYSLANAAIDSPCYSYASSPQGFPQWFNYSETWTGFSSPPSGGFCRFRMEGRHAWMNLYRPTQGTSNATSATASLPIAATSTSGYVRWGFGISKDNGTWSAAASAFVIVAGGTTAELRHGLFSPTNWTGSGGKTWCGMLDWEV